jgi:hypothetical protein
MSLFFTFYGEADVSSAGLQKVVVAVVGGAVRSQNTIFSPGMNVTVHHVGDGADEDSTGRYFGFVERITATFNFDNSAPADLTERNTVLMVATVMAIFDSHPGRGVLLFNGDRVVLERLDEGITFDGDWEDSSEITDVASLAAGHVVRRVDQPLL